MQIQLNANVFNAVNGSHSTLRALLSHYTLASLTRCCHLDVELHTFPPPGAAQSCLTFRTLPAYMCIVYIFFCWWWISDNSRVFGGVTGKNACVFEWNQSFTLKRFVAIRWSNGMNIAPYNVRIWFVRLVEHVSVLRRSWKVCECLK